MNIGILFLAVVALIAISSLAYCFLMLARNEWVYRVRTELLAKSKWDGRRFDPYDRLPSYDAMMRRFWIWDVERFL